MKNLILESGVLSAPGERSHGSSALRSLDGRPILFSVSDLTPLPGSSEEPSDPHHYRED